MECFRFSYDLSSILRPVMEDIRLAEISRTINSGTGSSNVPVESVQRRLERDSPEVEEPSTVVDDGVEDSAVSHSYANPRDDSLRTSNWTASFNSLTPSDMLGLAMCATGISYFRFMLSKNDPNIRRKIVIVVAWNVFDLMEDQYGNMLFRLMIGTLNIGELKFFFVKMASQPESLIRVSQTHSGSSSVRKLIQDFRQYPLIRLITSALAEGVYTLMTDKTGRKVIYKCFSLLDSRKREKLSEAVAQHCIPLSTHELGCRSLNECLEFITGAPRDRLLGTITHNSFFLADDFFGNYVLQSVLELEDPNINYKICSRLYGKYVHLSCTKIGSHVVQKCLGTIGIAYVIKELLTSNKFLDLARNQYGNFVVQTALLMTKVYEPASHQDIFLILKPQIRSLRQHPFGKNVYTFIERHFPATLE